ncbi:Glutamyl-tRNA(Gln) amidotransferase subunit C [Caulifigura coniformis]|uniref:Aspartyl/glutamyl-tRNA(Asn/Gln) amidotransferase subunit C n=1 Tax=Caulifigura coniformis TaxID=2527983 RepID=A0A517SD11_9PLAN|nr:Asp-tRNA(Asn)/Glu-tRNA(Gln) amidotransferase subunit GatC [Caulifigura coniformis]QDT53995.1 Glutamyl-tRNA(Gln) amidotransferase subunit C [Caulifigura coniformis]
MSDELTPDVVRRVARLSRLKLDEPQVAKLANELSKVLHYVDQLNELDVSNVEPMAHAIELTNVFRADDPRPSLPREAALSNAPRSDGKYFLVPPILDEK